MSLCFCVTPSYWGCCGFTRQREIDDDEVSRKSSLMNRTGDTDRSQRYDDDDFEAKHLKKGNYEFVSTDTAKLELDN